MPTRGLKAYSTMTLESKACSSCNDYVQLHMLTNASSKLMSGHAAICCNSLLQSSSLANRMGVLVLQVNLFLHCARATSVLVAREAKRREMGA